MGTHVIVLRDQEQRRQFVTQVKAAAFKTGKLADVYMTAGNRMYDGKGNRMVLVTVSELPQAVQGYIIDAYTIFIEPNLLDSRILDALKNQMRYSDEAFQDSRGGADFQAEPVATDPLVLERRDDPSGDIDALPGSNPELPPPGPLSGNRLPAGRAALRGGQDVRKPKAKRVTKLSDIR